MFIADLFIKHLRILESQLFVDKPVGRRFIESTFDNAECQINSRAHRQNHNQDDIFTHRLFTVFINELFPLEMHHTHTDKSCEANEYGIYEVEVKGSQKIDQITGSQPVTCRTKRRHQCRSDSDTRNHVPFFFRRKSHHTCQTTEKCDEYVINCRRCAGQQL